MREKIKPHWDHGDPNAEHVHYASGVPANKSLCRGRANCLLLPKAYNMICPGIFLYAKIKSNNWRLLKEDPVALFAKDMSFSVFIVGMKEYGQAAGLITYFRSADLAIADRHIVVMHV